MDIFTAAPFTAQLAVAGPAGPGIDLGGLLWLLFIGTAFYLMLRGGGCCGPSHENHGGQNDPHANHNGTASINGTDDARWTAQEDLNDPVCGTQVATLAGYRKIYKGHEYRFCSRECLDKFDADPERYLAGQGNLKGSSCH